jgi:hypothetical protein
MTRMLESQLEVPTYLAEWYICFSSVCLKYEFSLNIVKLGLGAGRIFEVSFIFVIKTQAHFLGSLPFNVIF